MIWVALALMITVSALVTAGGLCAAAVPRRKAIWAGLAAGLVTGVAVIALTFTMFRECWGEGGDPRPLSWPWSPRRQFCNDGSSAVGLGKYAFLLLPTILVVGGTLLRVKRHRALGAAAYAALLATPILPSLYVSALPYHRLDSYPILHQPLLRPAAGSQPPRVCYVYSIAHGPRAVRPTSDTVRHCVDLEPTSEALSLTPGYDEGRTSYDLEWMGKELAQKDLPPRPGPTGIDGLVVERTYELPDDKARLGATPIR